MEHYFTIGELMVTDTKLENGLLHPRQLQNLESLRIVLNVVRSLLGMPIIVNSGYRSPRVNAAVGGVEDSKHTKGLAADIRCDSMKSLAAICECYYSCGIFSEYINHGTYIHVAI